MLKTIFMESDAHIIALPQKRLNMGSRFSFSTAERATIFPATTGGNNRIPDMSIRTLPPCSLTAAASYHVRGKVTVQCRVPLCRDQRFHGLEIVKALENASASAIRAIMMLYGTITDLRLPFMTFFALPPDFFIAPGRNLIRFQRSVALKIPLRRNFGALAGQIVFAGDNDSSGANRTCRTGNAMVDLGMPSMPLFAAPPYTFMRLTDNILWRE